MWTRIRHAVGTFLNILFVLYFLIAFGLFTPYYNWRYAHDHGFGTWLCFGEIAPTLQALAWPYYMVRNLRAGRSDAELRDAEERYVTTLVAVSEELRNLKGDMAVLAGRVQERIQTSGKQAGFALLADGVESLADGQQRLAERVEAIAPPPRFSTVHTLLSGRVKRELAGLHASAQALRTDNDAALKRLVQEDAESEKQWQERWLKALQDAGLPN